ncbi:MAG TPA: hypothetical protein VFR37_05415 [Longimicrobium sp.]|nr:hypothetical protein [Longimicrobium sp.]
MSSTSRGGAEHREEMLLPLEQSPEPRAATPERSPPPAREERRPRTPRVQQPSPEQWAEEAIRQVQLRQGEITESWGTAADLLTRQIQAGIARLSEMSERTLARLQGAQDEMEATVTTLVQQLGELLAHVKETVESQTKALQATIESQGEAMAESAREATANIAVARHELSLSVAELERKSFRHGITLGAGMAILMLLAARLLFPFWGMQRPDVEAWNRGTRLLEAYEAATPQQQQTLLRTLGWNRMPGAPPIQSSTSSARPADGR